MIKKRINTDLFIKDLTFVDKTTQEAIDLSNANNIKLSVRRQGSTEWVDQQFTQTDNKISFQWNSTENTRIGTFDALLSFDKTSSVSETGTIEYKYDAISLFQIVLTSNEEDSVDDIIKEFDRWLDNKLEFKERHEIPADRYIGWISNT